ncbi:starch-binding protein [Flavobacterium psychrotolerans]|uniref:Uncharacterized protein n=1 Tax=Flavobacterium psychrotolerans TaxID=2169410 RepID=A0A2U1JNV6_9FLAO|nr:starch-binding protein [Flavobacterium psychrotolerans]PWA06857.1 hypothetical protein DB895_02415 [Flavobacterium psychrotolerans]
MKSKIKFLTLLFYFFHSFLFAQTKANGKEVMIQGFHWTTDISATKWYEVIKSNTTTLQNAGFDAIWLPPPSKSTGGMGYIPTVWYDLNTPHGTQAQLVSLISDLHAKNIKVLADIVINHRGGTTGWYDFSTPTWSTPGQTWSICNNSNISSSGQKGTGNTDYDPVQAGLKSSGESGSFSAARDLDHSNVEVRNGIKTWMNWLKTDIGFDGWRYDFVHGYDGKYIKEYNDATNPYYSVGELLEGDRNRLAKWIDYTKAGTATASSAAFDFATKSALQNAFNDNNLSYLKDGSGKAAGLIGISPEKACTMLDNHDTGPKPYGQDLWVFPGTQVLKGYAYILTHPGTPMVWWPHYFDWGIKKEIDAMIKIRKDNLLSSTSNLNIVQASNNLYAAIIDDKVALKLGSDNWSPSGTGWVLKLSGTGFSIWDKGTVIDVPSLTITPSGGTFITGTTVNVVLTANNATSTIYYTLDGSTPTTVSASAIGTKTLAITNSTTLKAFVKNSLNVSSVVVTEIYTFGAPTTFTVYFKKPSNWNAEVKIYYWSPTGTAPVIAWPGAAMTLDCGDWYKYTFPSTVSASNLLFNDGTLKTTDLTATAGIKYYDAAWLSAEPVNRCQTAIAPDLTISQLGGTFTTGTSVNVVLTANVTASTIYYTLDGSTPTTASASAIGTKTLAITNTTTLKAFVINATGVSSAIKTEVYTFTTPQTFTVYFKKPSNWNAAVKILYWSTIGTAPVVGVAMSLDCGDWYKYTFQSTGSTSNLSFNDGTLKTADLTITAGIKYYDVAWLNAEPVNRCQTAIAPDLTISKSGGTFSTGTSVNVVLTANVTASTIYYTLDGSTPTTASTSAIGTKTLAITNTTTLKAFVINAAGVSSAIKTEVYTFTAPPPTFTVYFKKPSNWNAAVKILYWSTTGSAPVVTWPGVAMTLDCSDWYKYTFPSTVSASNLSFNDGTLKTADLTITAGIKYYDAAWLSPEPVNRCQTAIAPDLTISKSGGTFSTGTSVSVVLTADVASSTIYYTLDGSTPTKASTSAVGTKTLVITSTSTLKAIVINAAGVSSAIKTEVYTFSAPPSTFTVYFKKPSNWNAAVKVLYWSPTGTAPAVAWPGVAMTLDCGDWYKYTFPSTVSASSLLFNDGTLKTVDLKATAGIKYYDNAWLVAEPIGRCAILPKSSVTVYFKPPTTWTTIPKVNYWNALPTGSVASTTWPGISMIADKDGFYKYTIVGPTSINVIFNNGSSGTGNQSPDLLNKTDGYSYTWGEDSTIIPDEKKRTAIIHPNPVIDILKISSESVISNYKIISIQGVILKEGKPIENSIDVSNLSTGIYFLQIKFENGVEKTQRFIKK